MPTKIRQSQGRGMQTGAARGEFPHGRDRLHFRLETHEECKQAPWLRNFTR